MLEALRKLPREGDQLHQTLAHMLDHLEDGRAKLYLTWRLLQLRRDQHALFTRGGYLALAAQGEHVDHVCAFARVLQQQAVLVIAPRWFARLTGDAEQLPPAKTLWSETHVVLPAQLPARDFYDLFSGTRIISRRRGDSDVIPLGEALAAFPVAALVA